MEIKTKALLVIAIWWLIIFAEMAPNERFTVRWFGHESVISRSEQPIQFYGQIAALGLAGTLVFALVSRGISKVPGDPDTNPFTTIQPRPRRIWLALNVVLTGLSVWAGYGELAAERLAKANPDMTFCAAILIGSVIFAIGICASAKVERLLKPSWSRFPLNSRGDPLQLVFIGGWSFLGAFLGALVRVGEAGARGFWTAAAFGSAFLGLAIGQLIAFCIYRPRTADEEWGSAEF